MSNTAAAAPAHDEETAINEALTYQARLLSKARTELAQIRKTAALRERMVADLLARARAANFTLDFKKVTRLSAPITAAAAPAHDEETAINEALTYQARLLNKARTELAQIQKTAALRERMVADLLARARAANFTLDFKKVTRLSAPVRERARRRTAKRS